MVEHGFDAGIRIGEMVEREMIGVRLSADLRAAVVASPGYFAEHGKPKHPLPGFFLYYPSRTHVAPKVQALVDFFKLRGR